MAVKGLLRDLIRRGLDFSKGLLCVIDGAKGLRKAIEDVFGSHALVQLCQWHKLAMYIATENVAGYLPKEDQRTYRRRLQRAHGLPHYHEAKEALLAIHADLEQINRNAARSLIEGLKRRSRSTLGLFDVLGRSLRTTNCIENLNSQLRKYLGKVKHWMHSDQRQRWMAAALLESERKMQRIAHADQLPRLREALQKSIDNDETTRRKEPFTEPNCN